MKTKDIAKQRTWDREFTTLWRVSYLATLCLCLLVSTLARAQETSATLLGMVHDPSGAAVANAKVTVIDVGTRLERTTQSNETGHYTLAMLPIGSYDITAEATGFKRAIEHAVTLHLAENLQINLQLELGAVTESVEVSGQYTRVDTEGNSQSSTVGAQDMQSLPLNGRDLNEVMALLPGTVSSIPTEPQPLAFNRAQASVSGASSNHNYWSQDGIFNMDTGAGGNFNDSAAIETVAEIHVVRSNYDAQYGVNGGAQVDVITKSGSNNFHGHFEEYFRNDAMDARNFFSAAVPPLRFNGPGFSVGGPLYIPKIYSRQRSKTYFFGAVTWQRVSRGATSTATIPTLAMHTGNFSAQSAVIKDPTTGQAFPGNIIPSSRIDKNAAAYAALYPPPLTSSASLNYFSNPWQTSNLRQQLIRVDHQVSQNHRLTFRGDLNNYIYINPGSALGYSTYRHSTLYTFGVALNSTFSPTLTNEFLFGRTYGTLPTGALANYDPQALGINIPLLFQNDVSKYPKEVLDVSWFRPHPPSISVTGFTGITFPDDTNSPIGIWQAKDNLSKVVGNHLLKTGILWQREEKQQAASYNIWGSSSFNGSYTGNGFADLLLGDVYSFSEVSSVQMPTIIRHTIEAYVQDQWKVAKNFTLNVGVRFTYMGLPTEPNGNFRAFIPSLYSAAQAPTILSGGTLVPGTGNPLNGLADPTSYQNDHQKGLAPRLGFSWDPFGTGKWVIRGGYGLFYNRESLDGIGFRQMSSNPPFAQAVTVFNTTLSNPGGGTLKPNPPSLITPNLYVPPQYYEQWNLSFQRSLLGGAVLDVGYAGTRGVHLARQFNMNQVPANLALAQGSINVNTIRPYPGYGNITLTQLNGNSIRHGLQTSLTENLHRGLTLLVSYTFAKTLTDAELGTGGNMAADLYNPRLEWGRSDIDATHNFVATAVYQLPFFKSQTGFLHRVLGGWQSAGTYLIRSGLPADVTLSTDVAGSGDTGQRPQIVCSPILPGGQRTPAAWFNTACYTKPALGTFATTSRNSILLPGQNNMNFTLLKRINLTEHKQFEIQGDLFNLFNHTQFTSVGTTFATSTFGVATAAAAPREVQLGVKLRW